MKQPMNLSLVVGKVMRRLLPLILLLTSVHLLAEDVHPLRVGVAPNFEPIAFKVSGELQGIEIDFARMVGKRLQRPVVFKEFAFSELIPALQANKIDVIMSGMSVTPGRANQVRFADPYMDIGQMAIVRTGDASKYGAPNALLEKGLKVGVYQGTTGEAWVRDNLHDADIRVYDGVDKGLEGLRDGDIDVFVHDSTTSWQLSRSFINDNLMSLNRFLTSESVAWAVSKDQPELQTTLNLVLKDMKAQGQVSEVIKRWLPVIPVTL